MKQRILSNLMELAKEPEHCKMAPDLVEATGLSLDELKHKAGKTINLLLNEYASFAVETIDSFNHRIIRTFARDLKIGQHTEISLEVDRYLEEAVDRILNEAGNSTAITKLLLDFTFYKMERGNSWNVSYDLQEAAPDVLKEVEQPHLELLKEKSLADFSKLAAVLLQQNQEQKQAVLGAANAIHKLLQESGAQRQDLYHHFANALDKFLDGSAVLDTSDPSKTFALALTQGGAKLYKKTAPTGVAEVLENSLPTLSGYYQEIRTAQLILARNKNIINQLPPTATLHLIREALEEVKQERDLMFISDFNLLIGEHIKNQPAPFIYERLGERYRHYFIDEFQDTSSMQWDNLIPLVENSLLQLDSNGLPGSLLVVGDAKQAIYRWRGGQAKQFVDLYHKQLPFALGPEQVEVIPLKSNWRSTTEIVSFNNRFFRHVGSLLKETDYQELYKEGNKQVSKGSEGGYITLSFVAGENTEERKQAYVEAVMQRVELLQRQGFPLSSICILTRKLKDGTLLGQQLLEAGIPVASEETLLLKNALIIQGVIATLKLLDTPTNQQFRLEVLLFLHRHFEIQQDRHAFLRQGLKEPLSEWKYILPEEAQQFRMEGFKDLPLLDSVEYIIGSLAIADGADPTLPAFMDLLLDFNRQGNPTISGFLDYWELKKDKASAKGPGGLEGVRIMTIHKAKGLEFPAVIVPFIESNTDPNRWDTTWYPLEEHNFDEVRLRYNKQIENYGPEGAAIYANTQSLVQLDMVNLLYVALTRPEMELHLLSGGKSKGPESCLGLFESFLKQQGEWQEDKTLYDWGEPVSYQHEQAVKQKECAVTYRVSKPGQRTARFVVRPTNETEEALLAKAYGSLLHEVMARIHTITDLPLALSLLEERPLVDKNTLLSVEKAVRALVEHPDLSCFFNETDQIFTEQELVTPDAFLIPDRFQVDPKGQTTLIDYKTGQPKESHALQVQGYKLALEAMGYRVKTMLLVYCREDDILINKV